MRALTRNLSAILIYAALLVGTILAVYLMLPRPYIKQIIGNRVSAPRNEKGAVQNSGAPLRIGIAGMTSPSVSVAKFKALLDYISDKLKVPVEIYQRKSYAEINDLLAKNEIDFAFICTGGYAAVADQVEVIAAPIFRGKSAYNSYIIANKNSGISSLADLKGKSFAFTDPLSLSGSRYPKWLLNKEGYRLKDFFAKVVYTYNHDNSIAMVQNRLVDAAAVDSLIYEYFNQKNPSQLSNINVIFRSVDLPSPPIVATKKLNRQLKQKIIATLGGMSRDAKGRGILKTFGYDGFATAESGFLNLEDYRTIEATYPEETEGVR